LSIEGRQRGRGLVTDHLFRRFGAIGPGLFDWDEWGLHRLTIDDVWAWATTRFTRANAVLTLSGPPPSGLRLDLFDGVHLPIPSSTPFHARLPATTFWDGPAGLTALTPRSRAAVGTLSIYAERVVQALRHEQAAAYSPGADYLPLDASTALIVAHTEAGGQQGPAVAWQLYQMLGELASNGPTPAEIDRLRDTERRADMEPDAAMRMAVVQADELLHRGSYRSAEEHRAEHLAVDATAVQASARGMWHSTLVAAPGIATEFGWNLPEYEPSGMPSISPHAQRYQRRSYLRVDNWSSADWLACSDQSVTLQAEGQAVTAEIGPLSVLLAHGDGSRVLVDRHGVVITIRPTAWEHGNAVVDWLDQVMGPDRTVATSPREFGPAGSSPDALRTLRGMDPAARAGKRSRRGGDHADEALVGPMRLDQWAPDTQLPATVPDLRRWMPSTMAVGWLAHRHHLSDWLEASMPDTLAAFRSGALGPLDLFAEVGGALYSDMASPAAAPFIADLILPPEPNRMAAMGTILGQAAGQPGEWWMATEQHATAVWAEMDQRWAALKITWSAELGGLLSPPVPALKVPPSRCQRVS
jgi:hypothetical protein